MASPDARRTARAGLRPTGGLKALADARKLDTSLILGRVQRHVVAKENQDLSRRQDILHPSEMSHSDWCPRASYYRIRDIRAGKEFSKEGFGFQNLNIFQHGHEVHHKWQTWLAEMGELWGKWSCRACEASWIGLAVQKCPECRSRHIAYDEIPLDAEKELLISGSADGGVPRHQALLEIKTVGSGTVRLESPEVLKIHTHKTADGKTLIDYEGLWRSITRPFPAHQKQGQLYLHVCKLRGLDFDKVVYVYESKFNQGTKEFVVKYRESLVAPLLKSASQVRAALDGGPLPACPTNGCKHCTEEDAHAQEAPSGGRALRRHVPLPGTAGRGRTGPASASTGRRRPFAP